MEKLLEESDQRCMLPLAPNLWKSRCRLERGERERSKPIRRSGADILTAVHRQERYQPLVEAP